MIKLNYIKSIHPKFDTLNVTCNSFIFHCGQTMTLHETLNQIGLLCNRVMYWAESALLQDANTYSALRLH